MILEDMMVASSHLFPNSYWQRRAVEAEAPRPEKHGDCMGGDDDDEELVVVTEASKELRLPHARMHCTAHPLPQLNAQVDRLTDLIPIIMRIKPGWE